MKPGDIVYINGKKDLFFDRDSREFIGRACVFIKKTKAGLYQVHLQDDKNKIKAFPFINVDSRI